MSDISSGGSTRVEPCAVNHPVIILARAVINFRRSPKRCGRERTRPRFFSRLKKLPTAPLFPGLGGGAAGESRASCGRICVGKLARGRKYTERRITARRFRAVLENFAEISPREARVATVLALIPGVRDSKRSILAVMCGRRRAEGAINFRAPAIRAL